MDLKELRDQIDQIDIQIQDLFEQRMDVVNRLPLTKNSINYRYYIQTEKMK